MRLATTGALLGLGTIACGATPPDDTAAHLPSENSATVMGVELFARLAGLWSGPATGTPLGSFPLKNMDLRPVGNNVLFGRVDLDADNSLRFAFDVEALEGTPQLVFRNGGLFGGIARDTRAKLVDAPADNYRFCAISGGCDYLNATFAFASPTDMALRVYVRGVEHEVWQARRVHAAPLPKEFPAQPARPADADFPPMASAVAHVQWPTPLAEATTIWVMLSTTNCIPSGACQFRRWLSTRAAAGATAAHLRFDQLHAGTYHVLGVVDANHNLPLTLFPDTGDRISVPSPTLEVPATGEAAFNVATTFVMF